MAMAEQAPTPETSNPLFRYITNLAVYGVVQEYIATHDPLTGLLKRDPFLAFSDEMLSQAKPGQIFAGLYVDLDNFKRVNDLHPQKHDKGDVVLQTVSRVLLDSTRQSDATPDLLYRRDRRDRPEGDGEASRLGGDEFALFVELTSREQTSNMKPAARLNAFTTRLERNINEALREEHPDLQELDMPVGASIGGVIRRKGETAEKLFARGDRKLTAVKEKHHEENGAYRTAKLDSAA